MSKLLHAAITSAAALLSTGSVTPAETARPEAPAVREIADVSLRDVAVAVYDPAHPVIYYNPKLMDRFGPEMQAFFMAHERAHIELRHTRSSALRAEPGIRDSLLQAKELEADCLAARRLGRDQASASMAAVHFFARLGERHFDNEHPPGSSRAARILSCMP
jgi:hypothetical protein